MSIYEALSVLQARIHGRTIKARVVWDGLVGVDEVSHGGWGG